MATVAVLAALGFSSSSQSWGSRAAGRHARPQLVFTGALEDYVAGFLASAVSTGAVYPIETYKVRQQAGSPFVFGSEESPLNLLQGIELGLAKECPNAAIYLGAYGYLRSLVLALPELQGREYEPAVLFWVALICGAAVLNVKRAMTPPISVAVEARDDMLKDRFNYVSSTPIAHEP